MTLTRSAIASPEDYAVWNPGKENHTGPSMALQRHADWVNAAGRAQRISWNIFQRKVSLVKRKGVVTHEHVHCGTYGCVDLCDCMYVAL